MTSSRSASAIPRRVDNQPAGAAAGDVNPLDALATVLAARVAAMVTDQLGEGDSGDAWMTTDQVADYLSWPKSRIYVYAERGELPHRKHERRLVFRRSEIDAWLAGV